MDEDYKRANREAYDSIAQEFEQKTSGYLIKHLMSDAMRFLTLLPGKRILDLGSGSGRDSLFFKQQGFDPLCLDLSPEMVAGCREKGLKAIIGDLERLNFISPESFDGVWAYTSLVHVPKRKFPEVLSNIKNVLSEDGLLYLGMNEGDFEGFIESDKYGVRRFFSFYSDEEVVNCLSKDFEILSKSKVDVGSIYLNYLARKK